MQNFFMRTTKTLIRLRGCTGWFESSLGAHKKVRILILRPSVNIPPFILKRTILYNLQIIFIQFQPNSMAELSKSVEVEFVKSTNWGNEVACFPVINLV